MKEEKVEFTNKEGVKLRGLLSNPTENKRKPVVILCHGFASSKESRTYVDLEKSLKNSGISSLRFDFFGHGESGGEFENIKVSEAIDDIESAIKFLREEGYEKIGLMASSFAGIAAIFVASRTENLFALALKCPVSDYKEILNCKYSKKEIDEWKERGFRIYVTTDKEKRLKLSYNFYLDALKMNGYEAAEKIKTDVLIVHGSEDRSVPVEQSRRLVEIIPSCRLEIIEGADHLFTNQEDYDLTKRIISNFIIEKSGVNK